jgi:hypothetical protein
VSSFFLLKEPTKDIRMTKTNTIDFLYYRSQTKHDIPKRNSVPTEKLQIVISRALLPTLGEKRMKIPPIF